MTPRIDWAGLITAAGLAVAGFAALVLTAWAGVCEYVRWRDRRGPRRLPQRVRIPRDDLMGVVNAVTGRPACSHEDGWCADPPRCMGTVLDDMPAEVIAAAAARLKPRQP